MALIQGITKKNVHQRIISPKLDRISIFVLYIDVVVLGGRVFFNVPGLQRISPEKVV